MNNHDWINVKTPLKPVKNKLRDFFLGCLLSLFGLILFSTFFIFQDKDYNHRLNLIKFKYSYSDILHDQTDLLYSKNISVFDNEKYQSVKHLCKKDNPDFFCEYFKREIRVFSSEILGAYLDKDFQEISKEEEKMIIYYINFSDAIQNVCPSDGYLLNIYCELSLSTLYDIEQYIKKEVINQYQQI